MWVPSPKGSPFDAHLEDSAQRIPLFAALVDQVFDLLILRRIERVDLAGVAPSAVLVERAGTRLNADAAQFHRVAEGRNAERDQHLLGRGRGGHPGRRLAALARSSTPRIEPRCLIAPVRSP